MSELGTKVTHDSDDFWEQDGWWPGRCRCGADLGVFPDAETACDALMQHARDAGYAEALTDAVAMQGGAREP